MEAVIVSTTSASEIASLGRSTLPLTYIWVVEAATKMVLVANKLVEVALVKTPVDGVTAPIGVLLMVPPEMVRPSTTNASVTELFGTVRLPETAKLVEVAETKMVLVANKLVEVALTARILVGLKLVAAKLVVVRFVKLPPVEVTMVPEAVLKSNWPDNVPPVKSK